MTDAIRYDHDDPEARTSSLRVNLWRCDMSQDLTSNDCAVSLDDDGNVTLRLSDDEAIALYEQLRATWAGYLAEMEEARSAVARGVTLNEYVGDWREAREQELRDAYAPSDPKGWSA